MDITKEVFRKALPKKCNRAVTDDLIDKINVIANDPDEAQGFKENLLSYTNVMADGKWKLEDYVNAVRYIGHRLMGATNEVAYLKTFPDRYNRLVQLGKDTKQISSHVAAYNRNILVNQIYEQTMIPSYILNAEVYQKAINVQAELMVSARSEKVRADAANSILNHLKRPEGANVAIDINVNNGDMLDQLRDITVNLAATQRDMIASKAYTPQEIAHQNIVIEGEVSDE